MCIHFSVQYTWDPAKAASNLKKHGVSFGEAKQALESDPNFVEDRDIDQDEPRLRVLVWSPRGRVLFVVLVERVSAQPGDVQAEETLRIITARKALRAEAKRYDTENGQG